jgi:hypothetical protein
MNPILVAPLGTALLSILLAAIQAFRRRFGPTRALAQVAVLAALAIIPLSVAIDVWTAEPLAGSIAHAGSYAGVVLPLTAIAGALSRFASSRLRAPPPRAPQKPRT